jgi:hypothetical protein
LNIEESFVDCRAQVDCGCVEEVFDLVDVGRVSIGVFWAVFDLQFIGGWFFSKFHFFGVGKVVLFGDKLQLVLLDVFAGEGIEEGAIAVGVEDLAFLF